MFALIAAIASSARSLPAKAFAAIRVQAGSAVVSVSVTVVAVVVVVVGVVGTASARVR